MKKFIILILCIQILNLPAVAAELIHDTFVEKTLNGKNLTVEIKKQQIIEDTFVDSTLKGKAQKIELESKQVEDTFVEKTLSADRYKLPVSQQAVIQDELANKTLKNCSTLIVNKKTDYDFESIKRTPVKIRICQNITTKNGLREGQDLYFKVLNDVKIDNNTTIKKDSTVKARLEMVSMNQAFGVPADITIENFVAKRTNQADLALDGSIHKVGACRYLWVRPVAIAGIVLLFGAGVFVFAVRGGHAKMKTTDVYEVYYIPDL